MKNEKAKPVPCVERELAHLEAPVVHRFERSLPHPPEKVFRALTDESELAQWFPATLKGPRRKGSELRIRERKAGARPEKGIVQVFEPPTRFVYTWGDQTLNWELTPVPGGCLLVLTTTRSSSLAASDSIAMAA
jgi:uncharacterized protein YndB with AHSA1/START domain